MTRFLIYSVTQNLKSVMRDSKVKQNYSEATHATVTLTNLVESFSIKQYSLFPV